MSAEVEKMNFRRPPQKSKNFNEINAERVPHTDTAEVAEVGQKLQQNQCGSCGGSICGTPRTYSVSTNALCAHSVARTDASRSATLRSSRRARTDEGKPPRRTGWSKLRPGDKTIKVGKRKLYLRPDQFEVERNGKWVVHLIQPDGRGEWTNIKLYDYHRKARKKVYYLSLRRKELTLAVGYDAGVFEKRHPELIAWVTEVLIRCRNNFGAKREGENVGG